jgi:hypothetical protein
MSLEAPRLTLDRTLGFSHVTVGPASAKSLHPDTGRVSKITGVSD